MTRRIRIAAWPPLAASAFAAALGAACHAGPGPIEARGGLTLRAAGPRLLFDEAHRNYHTATGRYRAFVELVSREGYGVEVNTRPFGRSALRGFDVLVVANAQGEDPVRDDSAFSAGECDAVREWVGSGGALLLIADHFPFAGAAAPLASRFGVGITRGIVEDAGYSAGGSPAFLVFTRETGLLVDHPITNGRSARERVSRVMSFGGSSLRPPAGATPILRLSPSAVERPALSAVARPGRSPQVRWGEARPVEGSTQGVALEFGKGRVVVLAEAGMLTEQTRGAAREPFGMTVAGIDNRQLALNVVHWLTRRLR